MFRGCASLISLPDVSKWNISHAETINYMFSGSKSLVSLPDISKWDTSNIEKKNFIFSGCNSLISIPDTSKWKNFYFNYAFSECFNCLNNF